MNRGSRVTRKVFSLLLAFLMVFGGMVQPFAGATEVYAASQDASNPTEVKDWAGLRDAVKDGGYIKITQDLVAEGSSIDITKDVYIVGDNATIWRKAGDANFPVFNVKDGGNLELGKGLTLTGLTGNCSGGEFKVVFHNGGEGDKARQTDPEVMQVGESIVKNPADIASDWAPETGLIFKGWKFKGPNGGDNDTSNNTPNTSTGNWKVPADKYGTMTLVAQWEKSVATAGEFKVVFHNGGEGDKAKQTEPEVMQVGESIVKDPADIASDWAPETGLVFKGWKFKGPNGGDNDTSNNTPNTSTGNWKVPADKYGTMTLVAQWEKPSAGGSGVMTTSDGRKLVVDKSTKKLQLHNIAEDTEWTEILSVEIQSDGKIKASSKSYPNEWLYMKSYGNPYLEKSPTGNTYIYAHSDTEGTVATASSNTINLKSTWPNAYLTGYGSGTWSIDGTPIAFSIGGSGGGTSSPYTSIEPIDWKNAETSTSTEPYASITTPDFVVSAGSGGQGCEGEGCKIWYREQFTPGTVDKPRGFFVQVDKGTLNITGATLKNYISGPGVENVAPVVVNGTTAKFNMSGGSINHNEVGYSADDSYINKAANVIEDQVKNNWKRTNSAGAVILTGGAEGSLTGGVIEHNRADAGAIIVEGNGTNSTASTQSTLTFTGGTINNNIGVHYGGGIYVYNNGLVEMGAEDNPGTAAIKDNFSWSKGGAVFASEEVYGSTKWNQPGTTEPVGDAAFILYGGTISGNMAVSRAGAIEVMSNHVILINGDIVNNSSRVLGGAIYVEGDGVDRMYTMVVRKGCISGNTAVKKTAQPATLSRVFKGTGDKCEKDNILGAPGAGTNIFDGKDYNNYYGYGGGIWLCSFGGNATFNLSDRYNVIVDGNTAATEGQDVQVHVPKAASPNGVNIVGVGNNKFVDEKTGEELVVGANYPGKLSIENANNVQGCDGIDGVNISGNVAAVGGGIAANGTVVFGEDTNVYAPMTSIKLSKTWGEGVNPETIKLKYYYRDDNGNRQEIEDLDGFEVTFDQKADIPGENDPTWEQIDGKGNSFADIAIPWTVTVNGETKPTFILGVDNDVTINYKDAKNNDRPFTGKEFDPSKEDHLAALWTGINNGTIDGTKLKIVKWNLEVVETNAAGEEIEYQLPDGEVANIEVVAHNQKQRTFYDKAKHSLASINTAPIGFNFTTNIANEGPEEPEIEKYVNQAVHKDITLDEVFTYDIHAYVTKDAEKVVITDTLVPYLDFATGANNWYIQDLGPSNNHEVAYTVKGEPTSHVGDATVTLISKDGNKPDNNGFAVTGIGPHVNKKIETVTVDGKQTKRMVVTIANAANVGGNDVRGHWIKIRFDAKIKSGVTISDLQAEGVYKTVNQSDVEDRKSPNNGNQPTTATANHTGVPNTAEYEITARNEAKYEDTSNTVTVKPDTTKVEAEKKWTNTDGSPAEWPEDVESVEVNVFKVEGDNRELTATIVLTADEPKKQSEDIPKLKSGQRYELEETVISGYASTIEAMPSGSLSQGSESGVVVTNKKDDTEKPEIEKYVNEAVHKDILLDEVFVYDILAYVTNDADEVTITDTLHHYLDFVSKPNQIYVQDIGPKNNHKVTNDIAGIKQNDNSSVSYINPDKMLDSKYPIGIGNLAERSIDLVTVDGKETKKLTIHIADAEPYRGHWVKVRFTAKIKNGTTLDDLEAAGVYKTIKQSDVEDRLAPNKGNQPTNAGATHTGVPNVAEYEIKVGTNPEYFDKSNTVTVKPETQELVVEKTWAGTENNEWPNDVTSVTFGIFQTKDGTETAVKGTVSEDGKYKSGTEDDAVVKLNKEKTTITVTGLPKLTGVTYSAREIKVDDKEVKYGDDAKTAGIVKHSDLLSYIVKMIREKLEGSEIDNKFIANNSAPAIEKYVNKTVHAELETFNEEFTYDIMAFVPAGSTKIIITDELKEQLTLNSTQDDIKATVVYKEENDHKVESSVKASGTAITEGVGVEINPANKVVITVKNTDGYLDGMWVQATLKAQIKENKYNEVLKKIQDNDQTEDPSLWWAKITKNEPVLDGDETHTGATNKASYKIEVGTESTSDYESNVVTVVPKTVTYAGEKAWEGLEEDVDWPQVEGKDIEVTFKLMKVDKDGIRSEVLDSENKPVTVKVTKDAPTQDFPAQPKIDGVTYEVEEEPIPGYMIAKEETTTDSETGKVTVKITNKPEGPEIEKYINKNVHKFIAPTETFTYDIIGYVTKDAIEVVFEDELDKQLQFAKAGANVRVADLGEDIDHKPNGSVSKTGKDITTTVERNVSDRKLTVKFGEAAAKAARGHWIKVTFDAELDSTLVADLESGARTIKDLETLEVEKGVVLAEDDGDDKRHPEKEGNLPVLTEEKHEGIPNTSRYTITAVDNGTHWDKSNTVTVEPEKPEIEKYINQNVHQDITLEDTFTYDIIAYVTKDADKVVITDTLVDDLEFVSKAADISVVDLGETVDHKPYGSVNKSGGFVKASPTISGKTLTITIADAKDYRGHWVKATFEAKLDATVIEAINAGTKEISDLGFVEIKPDELYKTDNSIYNEGDRPTPNVGNQPVESDEKHTGVPNTASYTISVGNENKYRDESNTVTVKPEKPSIEKYINKNVHEFVALDEVFTYDIIAYVPADADKVTITDELDKQLQFAKTGANVKVFDIGTTNNHKTGDKATEDKVNASVNNTDKEITDATIKATNGKLEVVIANKISNIDNNTGIITYSEEKLSQYRGHYIRVQFDAQPADNLDIKNLTTVEITDNEHLDVTEAQKEHEGIENKAKYTVNVGNDGKYESESNVVTVKPEEPEIEKYVNKKDATPEQRDGTVHTDLSAFDEVYTYDIQAYVTKDAKYVVVTDQLVDVLELVNSDNIKIVVKDGAGEDGETAPALSSTAGVKDVKSQCSADLGTGKANKLVFTFGSDANDAEVLDFAGKWIQITFDAKIKDTYRSIEDLKNKGVNVWTEITTEKNKPVEDADTTTEFSGATADSHTGIINDSSYTINKKAGVIIGNQWQYEDKSNTVTVQPKTIDIPVTKTWDDNDNQDGKRPESITINLVADGTKKGEATVTPAADGTWTYTFTGLPEKKADGTKITYTITEEPITDYSTAIDGYNVTNTHTPGKTAVSVEKVWDDEDNLDKTRPVLVAVALRADGAVQETVTLNESNNWKHTFTDLDLYSDGKLVEYTVDEVTVPEGYEKEVTLSGTTFIIKNSHKPNEFPIKISKKELGGDELEGAHIVVRDKNGNIVDEWDSTKTFHELNLKPGKYTMQETVAPEGFQRVTTTIEFEVDEKGKVTLITTTVDGGGKISLDGDDHLILEDAPEKNPEKRIITVSKVWNDFNDQDKLRPTEIQVVLKADGEEVETVTLNEANYWMHTWEELDMEKDGELIQYTLEEVSVPTGYTSSQRTTATVTTITNSHTPERPDEPTPRKRNIPVTKVWDDENNFEGHRPTSVTVNLIANGRPTGETLLLSDANNWTGYFTNLDAVDADGNAITYTVDEEFVPFYVTTILGTETTGYTVRNYNRPWIPEIPGTPGEQGKFSVQKMAKGGVPTDRTYAISVKMTDPFGEVYATTINLKPGDDPYYFEYVLKGTRVEIAEITTGYYVTYTVDGIERQDFTLLAGDDLRVIVLNDDAWPPNTPGRTPGVPKSGDPTDIFGWMAILALAAALAGAVVLRKRVK